MFLKQSQLDVAAILHRFLHEVLYHLHGSLNLPIALRVSRIAHDMLEVPSLRELSELAGRELWTIVRHHYFEQSKTVTSLHRSHTSFAYSNLVASARKKWRSSRLTVDSAVPTTRTSQHQISPKDCLGRHETPWAHCTVLVCVCCTHYTDSHNR